MKQQNVRLLIFIISVGILWQVFMLLYKNFTPTALQIQSNYIDSSQIKRKQRLSEWEVVYTTPKPLSREDSIAIAKKYNKCLKIAVKYHCSIGDAERLQQGKIWIGMTYEMLTYLRGKADHINVSNYGNGNQYQACWKDYTPGCVYFKASGEITAYN